MAFCTNCGQELVDGANFCGNCGKATHNNNAIAQRKAYYDGELRKCPNCGELLSSFQINCPVCGYELRNITVSNQIKEFSVKIEHATTIDRKVDLIRNFPIPNSKEDIYEFLVFASTNVKGESNKQVFNAWVAKFEQCYQKAELLFAHSEDMDKIDAIYISAQKVVGKERKKHEIRSVFNAVVKFFSNMHNPVFGIAVIVVIIVNIIMLITGTFDGDGTNLFYSAIILLIIYITSPKKSTKAKNEE